jgi:uncharacterized small protein (DUF1192 family)
MEIMTINHNTYKFSSLVNDMMKINNKELSSLSLKELEFYLEVLEDKIDELKAEDDIKHGRVISSEEFHAILLEKCKKK